jgi:pimeloyl-ACP methyl ester carboxylesterase
MAGRSATASSPAILTGSNGRSSQNANTYEEGFTEVWDGIRHALWANRSPETEAPLEAFLQPDTVESIYTTGHPDPTKISPDNWNMDLFFLARPNAHRVQLDLFYDYRTNVELYPDWQAFLRDMRPRTLILWGQGDIFFTPEGGEAYLRDLPEAELVRLDSGHFAVEDSLPQISDGITRFYETRVLPFRVAGAGANSDRRYATASSLRQPRSKKR